LHGILTSDDLLVWQRQNGEIMTSADYENPDFQEIRARWPGTCFACSQTNPHGLKLRFMHAEQGCIARCVVPDTMCGFDGMVHGGIIATILDEAAAWALFAESARFGVTREMTTRYLKAVSTGAELVVEGRVVSCDGRKAVVCSSLRSADGVLLAEAESRWVLLSTARISALTGVEEETLRSFLDDCRRETI
jgi:uncharacterized protein (TIGR00369 family)